MSTLLSGARVLSGSERAEGPASVRLGSMPVFKLGLEVSGLHMLAPSMRPLHMLL